jgi:hypothetical protein
MLRWLWMLVVGIVGTGCVLVETPSVRVGVVGSPESRHDESAPPEAPYAKALKAVVRQQDEVAEQLRDRDWGDLEDEAEEWVERVRELSGYAAMSHDPPRFRRDCDKLLAATEAVRRAARSRDPQACRRAIDACDPILDQFVRDFPATGSPKPQPTPSPPPPEPDSTRVP